MPEAPADLGARRAALGVPGVPGMDVREASVAEALAVIRDVGVEKLSLREVARRLGVSHQAPYKHYPSRDHLLAEVVQRCFRDFAAHLAAGPRGGDPMADLGEMGRRYLNYARTRPLEYRLMFGAALPTPADHPEMMDHGAVAFEGLKDGIAAVLAAHGVAAPPDRLEAEAIFIWSTLHGLASIRETEAMGCLGITAPAQDAMDAHVLRRLQDALGALALSAPPPSP